MRSVYYFLITLVLLSATSLFAKNKTIPSYKHSQTFAWSTSIDHGIEQTTASAMQRCASENGKINISGVVTTSETEVNNISTGFYNKYVSMLIQDTITSYKENSNPEITLDPVNKTFKVSVDLRLTLDANKSDKTNIDFTVQLNKQIFAHKDKAWIDYRLSEPLYILIAAVLEDSVSIWHYTTDKVDNKGIMRFPDAEEAYLSMTLSEGKTLENGAFCFVASRKMLPMALQCDKSKTAVEYIPKKLSVEQFYHCINSDDIELRVLPYVTK